MKMDKDGFVLDYLSYFFLVLNSKKILITKFYFFVLFNVNFYQFKREA